jgi:alkylation response protein AidB-like acyl-CoA dehydrogenase
MTTVDDDLTTQILETTRAFVEREVVPVAHDLEREDAYPEALIAGMAELGLFGMLVDPRYGGLGLDLRTYWRVVAEVSRGWMSLGGAINTHTIAAYLIERFGTPEQAERFLPAMTSGEVRGALAMTEANAGSDVAAIRTRAVRDGEDYVVNGTKMFITNGERAGVVLLLVVTDPEARPRHRGLSVLIAERGAGMAATRHIDKLGYNGIETVELVLEDYRCPRGNLLGGEEGSGFYQVMAGSEIGRINVAARAVGVARAALEEAVRYALERETFGKPIVEHQAIQFMLADMATSVRAAESLLDHAAEARERAGRADAEVGMAKLFASEVCLKVTTDAMRIHGGYGYTKEFNVERYYRDAPQMVVAEGTNEIQRIVIARDLVAKARAGL